jgi:hypothetical protein
LGGCKCSSAGDECGKDGSLHGEIMVVGGRLCLKK